MLTEYIKIKVSIQRYNYKKEILWYNIFIWIHFSSFIWFCDNNKKLKNYTTFFQQGLTTFPRLFKLTYNTLTFWLIIP